MWRKILEILPMHRMVTAFRNRLILLLCLFVVCEGFGQVPHVINFQGRVVVSGGNFNGFGRFKFALISAGGDTTYWSNDGTSVGGSEPEEAISLKVSKGLYSVLLGDSN